MCGNGVVNIARPKLQYPFTLEAVARSVRERHINIRSLLGVAWATDGVHLCVSMEVLQGRLAKPLKAFRTKAVNGKRFVERHDGRLGRISGSGEQGLGCLGFG